MIDLDKNKTDIIDRIYDVAIDPSRLEELVDVWEERIAPLRIKDDQLYDNSDAAYSHFSRMGLFLDRLQFFEPQETINKISETGAFAAIVVSSDLKIKQLNDAASNLFNVKVGDLFSRITPDSSSQEILNKAVETAINRAEASSDFLRFRLEDSERFIVVQVKGTTLHTHETEKFDAKKPLGLKTKPIPSVRRNQRLALIITTELVWRPSFGEAIQNAFNLTSSEVEIIRALTEGHTIVSIAKTRKRSKATVRSQISSIFDKTGTRTQAELIRISLSLMDITNFTEQQALKTSHDIYALPTLKPTLYHSITRPNNRRLDHIIIGDPNGTPILFFPGDYGFIRWTNTAATEAKARGIKVIVPVRAGFGKSEELANDINYEQHVSDDFCALMDYYHIPTCPIISQHTDFWLASIFAARYPSRVSSIIACAPMMPLWKKEQYERMDKWYRFIIANARYAPKILPYLVKAGFYLALTVGQRGFLNAIFSDCDADLKLLTDPVIFETLITGAEVALSKEFTAHKVFAREAIIQATSDWHEDLMSLKNKTVIHAFHGVQSPMVPARTLTEYQHRYNWINFHIKPDAGELIFYSHWQEVLDLAEIYL